LPEVRTFLNEQAKQFDNLEVKCNHLLTITFNNFYNTNDKIDVGGDPVAIFYDVEDAVVNIINVLIIFRHTCV
jgi:hypothetical protein